ncbi:MAG: DUF802 domain-containing protein [Burkholderiaceae bacterium]
MSSQSSSVRRILYATAFVAGLAVVVWVATGFLGSSAFALAMTVLIGAVYLAGAWELRRFGQVTAGLQAAMADVPPSLTQLSDWLPKVPASLQGAVQQRVEAERGGLPGPALTPYLVGLLVMLGMLGTFLGMVVTFKGAVFALEGSADLTAIRSALAAPIKGLGLSFGTSVAGVATSAMLGLMATLVRRERSTALRALDQLAATTLRPFSAAHQRQQSFLALQRQAEAMPAAAQHLQTLVEQMEARSRQLDEQLLSRHSEFQRETTVAFAALAQSVERSLNDNLAAGARAATEQLQPLVQQSMAAMAAESARMQQTVSEAVDQRLEQLSVRFGDTTATVADTWTRALAQHEAGSQRLLQGLDISLNAFHQGFETRASALLFSVDAAQQQARAERMQAEQQLRAELAGSLEQLARSLGEQWQQAGSQAQAQQLALLQALEGTAASMGQKASEQSGRSLDAVTRLVGQVEELVQARVASEAAWTEQHGQRMDALAALWRQELEALREQEARHQQQAGQDQAALMADLGRQLQTLRQDESERGAAAVQRLAELQSALASQLATLGGALEAPMARLMQTASEAPRAAAEVIGQLREQMSRLAERDNTTLAERAELVSQIGGLLQQVQQTTGEQRAAIEDLVGSATTVLDRVGQQFADTVGAQAGRAEAMAAQAAASAAQLASLGEAFQQGTCQLTDSHDQLVRSLQGVEGAIGQSMERSDEQLAYYVAQAREVIDLSISAQQGIIEDLRQLRGPKPADKAVDKASAGTA